MEPDNADKKTKSADNAADDLHAEGIDIVGTSMALDNEYSKPESDTQNAAPTPPLQETDATQKAPAPVVTPPQPKPIPREMPKEAKIPVAAQAMTHAQSAQNDPSIKPIRTFRTDAEEAVRYNNVSKADIALAEQRKREAAGGAQYEEPPRHKATAVYIGVVIATIALLSGGWYLWFTSTQSGGLTIGSSAGTSSPAVNGSAPTLVYRAIIPFEKATVVVIDPASDPISAIASKLSASNARIGNIIVAIPVTSAAATSSAPISAVFGETHIPARLSRSLASDYMIGTYEYASESPFIIIKNTYYQNAFAGMLDWEKNIGADLLPLIALTYPDITANSLGSGFEDSVISNVDVRALKDSTGRVVLAYAFPDTGTTIVATSLDTLKYLLDRMLQVRTIQ